MAWQIEQGEKCGLCGTFHWEWQHDGMHVEAYEADGFHCYGCEALQTEQAVRKDLPETAGTRVVLHRKE